MLSKVSNLMCSFYIEFLAPIPWHLSSILNSFELLFARFDMVGLGYALLCFNVQIMHLVP